MATTDPIRTRLGRIRCLVDTIERMKKGQSLPEALCFVPKELRFEYEGEEPLNVCEDTKESDKVAEKIPAGRKMALRCTGIPLFNSAGGWMKLVSPFEGWVLLQPSKKQLKGKLRLTTGEGEGAGKTKEVADWLAMVELTYTLQIVKPAVVNRGDEDLCLQLQTPPPGWTLEADEELGQFLSQHLNKEEVSGKGRGTEHFRRVEASSEEDMLDNILDSDMDEYWESDGTRGQHWLRFHMKKGVIIEKFNLLVDPDDGSYLPRRVVVKGGSVGSLSVLASITFGSSEYDKKELPLFSSPLDSFMEVIEVHVKSCNEGGIDVRVRGVALVTSTAKTLFLDSENISRDIFTEEKIARYPKLQPFKPEQLFHKALVLKRLAALLDLSFTYLLPQWSHSPETSILKAISAMRQLWPLSQKRNATINHVLSETSSSSPSRPVCYLNRMAAKEHREDPSLDPECSKTIFFQLLRELKKHTKPSKYNFRWAGNWDQWWECKFAQEGIIDQGGGFRDSLSDLAEELCPSDPTAVTVLPFFIRSPNQSQDSSNIYRDTYTLNPSCELFSKYQFIGQLMGAMLRSKESLVLSLPQFVWKQLVGETVTWSRDFVSVDSAEVKLLEGIESMPEEKFEAAFAGALDYTTVLSNGDTVNLVPGGAEKMVTYQDRLDYCRLVKEERLKECHAQMKALREGLTMVVPASVLQLLTWQELEVKVCGSPEISIEALKRSARYDSSLSEDNPRVKMMWKALEKFSNNDRSRFLRFITGRRRLPCTVFIDSSDSDSKLPTSATCSNTLYLPTYRNVEEAVDRLKYAAYNCIAIDTDMNAWD